MRHPASSVPNPVDRFPAGVAALMFSAVSLAAPSVAHAGGVELGLTAGGDRGHVTCVDTFACERGSGFVKASAGWRFDNGVDVQLHVIDAGRFKGGDTTKLGTDFGGTFKVSAIGVTAGWRWSFAPQWELGLRGGVATVRARFDYENSAWGSRSKTTIQPLAGIGIGYAITPQWRVGVDYDATRIKANNEHGPLQMLGASVRYAF